MSDFWTYGEVACRSRGCFMPASSYWAFDLNGCPVAQVTEETCLLPRSKWSYRFVPGPYSTTIAPNLVCYYPKARFRVKARSIK